MERNKEAIFKRMGDKWLIKTAFLKDVYFMMLNDLRFSSLRGANSIRYTKVSRHLKDNYGLDVSPKQLKYLVFLVKGRKG